MKMTELQVLNFTRRGIIDRILEIMNKMPDVSVLASKRLAEELLTLHSYLCEIEEKIRVEEDRLDAE